MRKHGGIVLAAAAAGVFLLLCLGAGRAVSISSSPDPFQMSVGNGEIGAITGYSNAAGRTLKSSVPPAPTTTAVIITSWQSNIESSALGSYSTTQATSYNFNIYDGGTYTCANPVLGAIYAATLGTNSANCQIADSLISGGTYTHVVMVPNAVGGTQCSDWTTGAMRYRTTVTVGRLKTQGLTSTTGFTGDVWVLPHGGETDAAMGTPRAVLAQCIRDYAATFVSEGLGTHRFFVPKESLNNNTTSSTVTNAQADAVASGCSTCRTGGDMDSLTGATNRQADGTHLTQTGAANWAALDVAIIANCKATAC